MGPDPDAALMLAFQRGDEGAFRTLFERHARAMVAFCHHFVRDAARAEELAQDVFLNVYRAKDRYQPSARFKTYLYRVASNLCLNELRRPARRAALVLCRFEGLSYEEIAEVLGASLPAVKSLIHRATVSAAAALAPFQPAAAEEALP